MTASPTLNWRGCRHGLLRRIAGGEIVPDLIVDLGVAAAGLGRRRVAQKFLGLGLQLLGRDVAFRHVPARDPAQPFLVVAEPEIVERRHGLGTLAQVGPGPLVLERGRHVLEAQMLAQGHHRRVDGEDRLFPGFDEHALLGRDRVESFEPAQMYAAASWHPPPSRVSRRRPALSPCWSWHWPTSPPAGRRLRRRSWPRRRPASGGR